MPTVYIGIGSNLGDRKANCLKAIELMGESGVAVKKRSSMYETEPWGVDGQPKFINMAVEAETGLEPGELKGVLNRIESALGRVRGEKWAPRSIDLDILLYDSIIVDEPDLKIPHPIMHERDFVLVPLSEIAPDAMHPIMGKTVRELLSSLRRNPRSL